MKDGFEMKFQKKIRKKKEKTKQCTDKEMEILLFMSNLLTGLDDNGGPPKGWQSLLLNTWGMNRPTFNYIFNRCIDRGFDCGRKERSYEGQSIFVSESRRNQTFTALNEYKIQRGQELRDSPDKMCGKMLREDFI